MSGSTALVIFFGYLVAKGGRPQLAAVLLIALGTVILMAAAVTRETDNILLLFFLLLIMLFTNLFFSAKAGVLVYFAHVALMLCLPLFTPKIQLTSLIQGPLAYYTTAALISVAFAYIRDQLESGRWQQIANSEARIRAAVEGSFDAFFLLESVHDSQGTLIDFHIVDANKGSEQQTGMQREIFLGHSAQKALPALFNNGLIALCQQVANTGEPVSGEITLPSPLTDRWFQYHVVRVGEGVAVFTHEITEQKQVQDILRESENRYRLIFGTTSDFAFSVRAEPDGSFVLEWITESFARATGYPLNISLEEFGSIFHPDDLVLALYHLEAVLVGKRITFDYRIITRSGELRWFQITRWPEWDEQLERLVRYLSIAQDITDRKRAEQTQREQERLRIALETERELGELKSKLMVTISHEFRTPLATIQASSEILQRYFNRMTPEQRESHAEIIRKQVAHLTEMLEDISFALQNFGVHMRPNWETFDLVETCRLILEEMRYTLSEHQTLKLESAVPTLELQADAKLISRMVRNLIANAIKYSPNGGEIRMSIGGEKNSAVLLVSDQGIGISPEDQEHVFRPFFRASNSGFVDGTGIGLSIVKDCVALHDGDVSVQSELGKGSTFIVRLPLESSQVFAHKAAEV